MEGRVRTNGTGGIGFSSPGGMVVNVANDISRDRWQAINSKLESRRKHPPSPYSCVPPTDRVSSTVHVPRPSYLPPPPPDTPTLSPPHPPPPGPCSKANYELIGARREGIYKLNGELLYVTPEISRLIKRARRHRARGQRYLWDNVTDGLYFRSRTATRALWRLTFVLIFATILSEHIHPPIYLHTPTNTCTADSTST